MILVIAFIIFVHTSVMYVSTFVGLVPVSIKFTHLPVMLAHSTKVALLYYVFMQMLYELVQIFVLAPMLIRLALLFKKTSLVV